MANNSAIIIFHFTRMNPRTDESKAITHFVRKKNNLIKQTTDFTEQQKLFQLYSTSSI